MKSIALALGVGVLSLAACRSAPPPCTDELAPCTSRGSMVHGGRTRTWQYHLPPGLKPGAPLLLSLHGRYGKGESQADLTGYDTVADEAGFIVVYPDGVDRSWADGRGTSPADKEGVDDVGFLVALMDAFIEQHGADPRQVYVSGMSNGAIMSYRLACERPDRVAALAPVAGLMAEAQAARCTPARMVPLMGFLGAEDKLVPLQGGEVSGDRGAVLSLEQTRAKWAELGGCASQTPAVTYEDDKDPSDGTRVRREVTTGCRDNGELIFFVVEGGGHTWPGGLEYLRLSLVGRTSKDIHASRTAWQFFQRFRLP